MDSKHGPVHSHDILFDLVIVWIIVVLVSNCIVCVQPTKPGRDGDTGYGLFFKLQQQVSSQLPIRSASLSTSCSFFSCHSFPSHPHTSNARSSIERMSSRILEEGLSRTPSRPLVISSPFLLARFVVFCQYETNISLERPWASTHASIGLLIYMSLTALGFAAWNVGASRAAGANGEHTSIRISPSSPAGILIDFFFMSLDSCWSIYLPHI